MMRVAYVCADPGIPVFGTKGASVHVQEVLRVLLSHGASVDLFCRRTGGVPQGILANADVHMLPMPRHREPAVRETECIRADGWTAEALRAAGAYDLVYERYSLWSSAGMAYARHAGVPAVLEVNAPLIDEQARHRALVHRAEAEAVFESAVRDATVAVCVSDAVAAWARTFAGDTTPVVVQPNGVDVDRFAPVTRRGGPTPFTVGFVGSLRPWHGIDVLVDAFARLHRSHPDTRLLVVGDGPLRESLAELVGSRGLGSAVELTGAVPPTEIPRLLDRMDVAVAPYPESAGHYFSPLKVYEYLAAGLPVVASDIGQVGTTLTQGVDGVLVPPGDAAALATQLASLRADGERRERLGRAARVTAETRHTWTRGVANTLDAAGFRLPTTGQEAA